VRRRRALLRAVLRIVAREGVAAVTHRAVAAEAEASLRATTYYFATKEEMIREAFRLLVATALERIEAAAAAFTGNTLRPGDVVDAVADLVSEALDDPDGSLSAGVELNLAISRDGSFAHEYQAFRKRLEKLLQELMRQLGSRHPARQARIVLEFIRGFELEQLSRPERSQPARALKRDLRYLMTTLLRDT
jgi:DNA-binding transcriptional regulator YbjK